MKKFATLLGIVVIVAGVLAVLNPNEADYREYVRQKQGIAGTISMAVADLLAGGASGGGIKRENFFVASRFYIGGDGVLPREDVAWGFAGRFWDTTQKKPDRKR